MGGRGSTGGKSFGTRITSEDWEEWSQDPSIFQRLERGEDLSEDFYEMYEEDWESEYSRVSNLAKAMQSRAESETVDTSTLYRGERFNSLEEAQRKYSVGNTVTLDRLTSYSKNESLAREYATMYNGKVAVVITNKSTKGNFVGVQTSHPGTRNDPEVLAPRGLSSKVTKTRYDRKTNTLYVTMENSIIPRRKR